MINSFQRQQEISIIPHELVIVDNNSSDCTEQIVQKFRKNGNVKYCIENKQGLSHARNRGIRESRGEVVAFLDDDMVIDELWLLNLQRCITETRADVIGGKILLSFDRHPEAWLGSIFRRSLGEVDLGQTRKVICKEDELFGGNISFKKEVFEKVGYFDCTAGRIGGSLVGGEEIELVRRILSVKGYIVYDPKIIVHHVIGDDRLEWSYFRRLAVGTGKTEEFLEPRRNKIYQLLRVFNATKKLMLATASYYMQRNSLNSEYERKLLEYTALRRRGYLIARCARFINANSERY